MDFLSGVLGKGQDLYSLRYIIRDLCLTHWSISYISYCIQYETQIKTPEPNPAPVSAVVLQLGQSYWQLPDQTAADSLLIVVNLFSVLWPDAFLLLCWWCASPGLAVWSYGHGWCLWGTQYPFKIFKHGFNKTIVSIYQINRYETKHRAQWTC